MTLRHEVKIVEGLRTLAVQSFGWDNQLLRGDVVDAASIEFLSVTGVESDVGFLEAFPNLKRLSVTIQKPRDLAPVAGLTHLRDLMLQLGQGAVLPFDLTRLPNLRRAFLDWRPAFASVADCRSLEALGLYGPVGPELDIVSGLSSLRDLKLGSGRRLLSLRGIGSLTSLESLDIYAMSQLSDLADIDRCVGLRVVRIEACKRVTSLEPVVHVPKLEKLGFSNSGDLESLAPLRRAVQLREFLAWESTRVVDGDLSPLLDLPELRRIAMRSRREYSPSVNEIRDELDRRHGPTER